MRKFGKLELNLSCQCQEISQELEIADCVFDDLDLDLDLDLDFDDLDFDDLDFAMKRIVSSSCNAYNISSHFYGIFLSMIKVSFCFCIMQPSLSYTKTV